VSDGDGILRPRACPFRAASDEAEIDQGDLGALEMADKVGKPLAQGIGVGFNNGMKEVLKQMSTTFSGLSLNVPRSSNSVSISINPREMSKAQTDYLVQKINREFGRMLALETSILRTQSASASTCKAQYCFTPLVG
jgi:hypothetical protein